MRPIDADALIDEIKYFTGQDTIMRFYDRNIEREQEVNMAAFIELMPTIDAVPVKCAKLVNPNPFGECSTCGYLIDVREEYRYCPMCGSRIDGGEE